MSCPNRGCKSRKMKPGDGYSTASFKKTSLYLAKPPEINEFDTNPISHVFNLDLIESNTSDLNTNLTNIIEILDTNPESIATDQYRTALTKLIRTIEMSMNGVQNIIKLQNAPIKQYNTSYAPQTEQVISLIIDYIQLATKTYNENVLYTYNICPFLMFFINMSTVFIDIFQNPNTIFSTKDFQMVWSDNYYISLRIPKFLKELGIRNHFLNLSNILDFNSTKLNNPSNRYNELVSSFAALDDSSVKFESDDVTLSLLKNMLTDIRDFRLYFMDFVNLPKNTEVKQSNQLYEKVEAINHFESILEIYLCLFNLMEMVKKINQLVENESFSLPPASEFSNRNQWICFKQLVENIQMNTRILDSIYMLFKQQDTASAEANARSKEILTLMSHHVNLKIDDRYVQLINCLTQIKPITDESLFQTFVQFYNEQIENQKNNSNDLFQRGKNCFERFRVLTKIFQETPNLITASSRFSAFSNFEDCYRYLQIVPEFSQFSQMNDTLFAFKFILMSHVCFLSNKLMIQSMMNLQPHLSIPFYQEQFMITELQSRLTNFLSLVTRIKSKRLYAEKFEDFIECFIQFLEVSSFLMKKKTCNTSTDFITFILSSFPSINSIKQAFSFGSLIENIKKKLSQVQNSAIKSSEFESASHKEIAFPIELVESSKHVFENKTRMSEICHLIEQLDYIKLCIQLFLLYESFFNQFVGQINRSHEQCQEKPETSPWLGQLTHTLLLLFHQTKLAIPLELSHNWIMLYRPVLLNDNADVKETFLNEIPFINLYEINIQLLYRLRKIESSVLVDIPKIGYGKQLNSILNLHFLITNKIRKIIIGKSYEKEEIDHLVDRFLTQIFNISPELYAFVQKNWVRISSILNIFQKVHHLNSIVNSILGEQFQLNLFFLINLFKSILWLLIEMVKSEHVSIDLLQTEQNMSKVMYELKNHSKTMFSKQNHEIERIYYLIISSLQELTEVSINTKIEHFTNSFRFFVADSLPLIASSIQTSLYDAFEGLVRDSIVLIDRLEESPVEQKFHILREIKRNIKKMLRFNSPIINEFAIHIMTMVMSEINFCILESQIACYHQLLLQIAVDRPSLISSIIFQHPSFNFITDSPIITKTTEIYHQLNKIIDQYCQNENPLFQSLKTSLLDLMNKCQSKTEEIKKSLNFDPITLNQSQKLVEKYKQAKNEYDRMTKYLVCLKLKSKDIKHQRLELLRNYQLALLKIKNQNAFLYQEYKKMVDAISIKNEFIIKLKERQKTFDDLANSLDSQIKELQNLINHARITENPSKNSTSKTVGLNAIIDLEEKFARELARNNELWTEVRNLASDKSHPVVLEPKRKFSSTDTKTILRSLQTTPQNVNEKYDMLVQTIYEIFRRIKFCKEALFSQERRNNPFLNAGHSATNLPSILALAVSTSSFQDSAIDDEEAIDLLFTFTNELFDKSLKFYFTNQMFHQLKCHKKKAKIKVKKPKKSILSKLLEEELQCV